MTDEPCSASLEATLKKIEWLVNLDIDGSPSSHALRAALMRLGHAIEDLSKFIRNSDVVSCYSELSTIDDLTLAIALNDLDKASLGIRLAAASMGVRGL